MNYFNDLNPYLVRQDNDNPTVNEDGSINNPSPLPTTNSTTITPAPVVNQAYIENILRLNIGKLGSFFFTYSNSNEWRDKVYKGVLEQAGRDHFIIHDPKNDKRYLLQLVYLTWAEFDEPINYQHPYQ